MGVGNLSVRALILMVAVGLGRGGVLRVPSVLFDCPFSFCYPCV